MESARPARTLIEVTSFPKLDRPVLIAAFEGWNDAGDAASGAVEHLELTWDAQLITEVDSDDFYDFQVNRPIIKQVDGVTRAVEWPSTTLSVCRPPKADRDVVLLRGTEPNFRWRAFCDQLLTIFTELHIDSVVILGSLLADTPHTRPVPVTGAGYDAESAKRFGLEQNRYEGPTGITGVLQDACVRAGFPAVSFWAAVPHYVSQPPNPKATVALLQRVEQVLDLAVPLNDLPTRAEAWEASVTEMTEDDEDVADYVRGLEERGDAEAKDVEQHIDADAIAEEFEKYLRRRDPGTGP
ncbi:PAC2 family protein [Tsukamurella tyrosinosolvens]|uniref:PAC2 family protein n=1 Tax=Tsukamurella tyrosinosolvens TaxID=57704 RepID=UPI00079320A3|nr:carboxylate--amine ligase [Tsukamurella tyrosinosolvens]KXP06034.1 carboxylate--amine ligase [Tsukamurella tyrosinosolvens]KZL95865.1 carboxylate--amine ligase [Tsukamurella tyrosinosolvens]MCA4993325.1 PAC2 family protein [Tsukamurella tyrosinosolvens]